MADELTSESTVTYTVREILDGHGDILRSIDTKLDGKADKSDVLAIASDVREHDGRISTLEHIRRAHNRAWAIALSVAGVLAVLGGSLIAALVH